MKILICVAVLSMGMLFIVGCQSDQSRVRMVGSDSGTNGDSCLFCYEQTTKSQSLPNKGAPFQRTIESEREVCVECGSATAACPGGGCASADFPGYYATQGTP